MSYTGADMTDPAWMLDSFSDVKPFGWTERANAERQKQLFSLALGKPAVAEGSERRASDEEIHDRAVFLAYRWSKWLVQALGLASLAEPLSFVTEVKGLETSPEAVWGSKLLKAKAAAAVSTLPGRHRFLATFHGERKPGAWLQPPPYSKAADRIHFLEHISICIGALKFRKPTSDRVDLGIFHVDPATFGELGVQLEQAEYEVFQETFPDPDEILEYEQEFMTGLADALAKTTEDGLRSYLRGLWGMCEYEAFSMVQTAKGWAAAMRPIDVEVERRNQVRRLEAASVKAAFAGDHRAEIMASTQISRILGLAQNSPVDENEAAALAAASAHEGHRQLQEDQSPPELEPELEPRTFDMTAPAEGGLYDNSDEEEVFDPDPDADAPVARLARNGEPLLAAEEEYIEGVHDFDVANEEYHLLAREELERRERERQAEEAEPLTLSKKNPPPVDGFASRSEKPTLTLDEWLESRGLGKLKSQDRGPD